MMNFTVVSLLLRGLDAVRMVARVDLLHLRDVLPEVESFSREHVGADRLLEVFVRDFSISIKIQLFEEFVELIVRQLKPPKVELVPQFFWTNIT